MSVFTISLLFSLLCILSLGHTSPAILDGGDRPPDVEVSTSTATSPGTKGQDANPVENPDSLVDDLIPKLVLNALESKVEGAQFATKTGGWGFGPRKPSNGGASQNAPLHPSGTASASGQLPSYPISGAPYANMTDFQDAVSAMESAAQPNLQTVTVAASTVTLPAITITQAAETVTVAVTSTVHAGGTATQTVYASAYVTETVTTASTCPINTGAMGSMDSPGGSAIALTQTVTVTQNSQCPGIPSNNGGSGGNAVSYITVTASPALQRPSVSTIPIVGTAGQVSLPGPGAISSAYNQPSTSNQVMVAQSTSALPLISNLQPVSFQQDSVTQNLPGPGASSIMIPPAGTNAVSASVPAMESLAQITPISNSLIDIVSNASQPASNLDSQSGVISSPQVLYSAGLSNTSSGALTSQMIMQPASATVAQVLSLTSTSPPAIVVQSQGAQASLPPQASVPQVTAASAAFSVHLSGDVSNVVGNIVSAKPGETVIGSMVAPPSFTFSNSSIILSAIATRSSGAPLTIASMASSSVPALPMPQSGDLHGQPSTAQIPYSGFAQASSNDQTLPNRLPPVTTPIVPLPTAAEPFVSLSSGQAITNGDQEVGPQGSIMVNLSGSTVMMMPSQTTASVSLSQSPPQSIVEPFSSVSPEAVISNAIQGAGPQILTMVHSTSSSIAVLPSQTISSAPLYQVPLPTAAEPFVSVSSGAVISNANQEVGPQGSIRIDLSSTTLIMLSTNAPSIGSSDISIVNQILNSASGTIAVSQSIPASQNVAQTQIGPSTSSLMSPATAIQTPQGSSNSNAFSVAIGSGSTSYIVPGANTILAATIQAGSVIQGDQTASSGNVIATAIMSGTAAQESQMMMSGSAISLSSLVPFAPLSSQGRFDAAIPIQSVQSFSAYSSAPPSPGSGSTESTSQSTQQLYGISTSTTASVPTQTQTLTQSIMPSSTIPIVNQSPLVSSPERVLPYTSMTQMSIAAAELSSTALVATASISTGASASDSSISISDTINAMASLIPASLNASSAPALPSISAPSASNALSIATSGIFDTGEGSSTILSGPPLTTALAPDSSVVTLSASTPIVTSPVTTTTSVVQPLLTSSSTSTSNILAQTLASESIQNIAISSPLSTILGSSNSELESLQTASLSGSIISASTIAGPPAQVSSDAGSENMSSSAPAAVSLPLSTLAVDAQPASSSSTAFSTSDYSLDSSSSSATSVNPSASSVGSSDTTSKYLSLSQTITSVSSSNMTASDVISSTVRATTIPSSMPSGALMTSGESSIQSSDMLFSPMITPSAPPTTQSGSPNLLSRPSSQIVTASGPSSVTSAGTSSNITSSSAQSTSTISTIAQSTYTSQSSQSSSSSAISSVSLAAQQAEPSTSCLADGSSIQSWTANYDDLTTLAISNLPPGINQVANSLLQDDSPLDYEGLTYTNFMSTVSPMANTPPNVITAKPSNSKIITPSRNGTTFTLNQIWLSCTNDSTATDNYIARAPANSRQTSRFARGIAARNARRQISATQDCIVTINSTNYDGLSSATITIPARLQAMEQAAFGDYDHLTKLEFSATRGGQQVGLTIDSMSYDILGNCSAPVSS